VSLKADWVHTGGPAGQLETPKLHSKLRIFCHLRDLYFGPVLAAELLPRSRGIVEL
jgi:hypothetical protein